VAIAGATPGRGGTIHAQDQLRQVLRATGANVLPRPDLLLAGANDLFDDQRLVDEGSRRRLERLLAALAEWTRTLACRD
jgi:chromate reductase